MIHLALSIAALLFLLYVGFQVVAVLFAWVGEAVDFVLNLRRIRR